MGHIHFRHKVEEGGVKYICACLGYRREWRTKEIVHEIRDALEVIEIWKKRIIDNNNPLFLYNIYFLTLISSYLENHSGKTLLKTTGLNLPSTFFTTSKVVAPCVQIKPSWLTISKP